MKKEKISRLKKVFRLVVAGYFEHNVAKNAAALAYYLLFAIFPLLIFVSNLLGFLDFNVLSVTQILGRILPRDIVGIIENYFEYVSSNSSHVLMWFSLVFSIWFPMRAVRGLMGDVRRAYGLDRSERPVVYVVKQLVYTVVFLVVMVLTLVLSAAGKNVLGYVAGLFSEDIAFFSDYLLKIWHYLRFILVAVVMLAGIGTLYSLSLDKRPPVKKIIPGIFTSLLSWMIVSVGFSFYAENFAKYTIIYGTLGAVIVLLMWLYITAFILILGAELNAALEKVPKDVAI